MLTNITVKTIKRSVVNAHNRAFFVHGGGAIQNLYELKDALYSMDATTFAYHVNKEKNDFALWVKEVLDDEILARQLVKSKTAKAAAKAVETHLKKYYI